MTRSIAPELQVTQWFNTDLPIALADLHGRVVVIEAFQMLCPGCVSHGLPLAQRVAETFDSDDVVVLGLHTVFEHHAAQGTPEALAAFLDEYKIRFPVGLDTPSPEGGAPLTMRRYNLRGTPSMVLIDRNGEIRQQYIGAVPDLLLGAEIMALVNAPLRSDVSETPDAGTCDVQGCTIGDATPTTESAA